MHVSVHVHVNAYVYLYVAVHRLTRTDAQAARPPDGRQADGCKREWMEESDKEMDVADKCFTYDETCYYADPHDI